ncbi:MAG: hypothetical protein IJF32_11020, partial [Oscillospiraceae bacterium]|nr:hypothetical protein [Oscillospiraceae bacterium]
YLNWTIKDETNSGVVFAPGEESVSGVRAALAFEISASKGTYDASLSVKENTTSTSTELEVYLVPKADYIFPVYDSNDAENSKASFYKSVENMSANYRIGKIDLYNKSGDVYIGRVGLTAENYYLVLVPCGVNESAEIGTDNLWTMQLTNFKLDAVSESEGEEQDISDAISTAKQTIDGWTYSKYFTVETEGNVLTAYGACIYSYENTTDRIPMAVVEFTASATGTYNLQLKTNSDGISIKKFAAAPLVSYAKYDSVFATAMSDSLTSEGDTATALKALAGYNEIGYFDFSEQTAADTYSDVKKDGTSGTENGVLSLEAGQKYFLAFLLDTQSLALASGTVGENVYSGGAATGNETITEYGTKPSSATKAYQAFIISGINLVPVVDETEVARQEAYIADRALYNTLTSVTAENNTEKTLDGYSSNATVTVVAQDIATGASIVNDVVNENVAVNSKYSPVAPSVSADYEFMYWAIGLGANRKIVSFDKDEYSFEVAPGRNLVYAVYRKTNNDTKYAFFFDGSKTVLGKKAISAGSVTLPALPGAMPGFGNPTGWKYTGEENENAL